ncbi:FAD-dependent oxidoreductase [Streptomyces sp. DSM 44915]|uniref:FAD-dependent oxidoreductase n=1 Tax=Streptomyces chisholmiae TaxID=3075540 RepID=A0ABU2JVE2_9ACTN|nr:FAD-dependent oxidoreductase [Streptomyces sp. DSM 44915]MDT0268953.1 FAD-dependent oxidoreductase [Streptomyces sp. DSM 44915]
MTTPPDRPFDLAVVGAGPAGLAAAVTAAAGGASVLLLDAGERPGGQFWRHPGPAPDGSDAPDEAAGQHDWGRFLALRRGLRAQVAAGRLDYRPGRQVWLVTREEPGFRIETTATHDGVASTPGAALARTLVLCPGGADRQLPVPGWTLPGVLAAGGAQALWKGQRALAGRRAVVAGTGPFLLPVATGLAAAGARVVGVWEAGSPLSWTRHLPAVARVPGKAAEGAGYVAALARHRIPYLTRTVVAEVLGEDRVRAVRRGTVDAAGVPTPDGPVVEVDLVALGWGFTPALELPLQLGAATRLDVDGSLVVVVDEEQRTDVPGLFVAGEATGVGGAALSVAEGTLAGLAAAGRPVAGRVTRRLRARVAAHRAFARAMHLAHPVPAGWSGWLRQDTVVCRCEEVDLATVRAATDELAADDARTVKMLTRAGMGWCQGRMCGFATACLAAEAAGRRPRPDDLRATATRPLAAPVPLAELAELAKPGEPGEPAASDGPDGLTERGEPAGPGE